MEKYHSLNVTDHILKLTCYSLWSASFIAFAYTSGVPPQQVTDKNGTEQRQLGDHQEPGSSDYIVVTPVPFLSKHLHPLKLQHDPSASQSLLPSLLPYSITVRGNTPSPLNPIREEQIRNV